MVKRRKVAAGEFHDDKGARKPHEKMSVSAPEAPPHKVEKVTPPNARLMSDATWLAEYSRHREALVMIGDLVDSDIEMKVPKASEVVCIEDISKYEVVQEAFKKGARIVDGDFYGEHFEDTERGTYSVPIQWKEGMPLGHFLAGQYKQKLDIISPYVAGLSYAVTICKALKGFTKREMDRVKDFRKHFEDDNRHMLLFPGTVLLTQDNIKGVLGIRRVGSADLCSFALIFFPYSGYIEKGTAILYF